MALLIFFSIYFVKIIAFAYGFVILYFGERGVCVYLPLSLNGKFVNFFLFFFHLENFNLLPICIDNNLVHVTQA